MTTFSPIDYGFRWTKQTCYSCAGTGVRQNPAVRDSHHTCPVCDGAGKSEWYEYDGKEAERKALKARNDEAKRLQSEGHLVRKASLGKQLVSMGGIGSGHPHIELVVPVYGLLVVA